MADEDKKKLMSSVSSQKSWWTRTIRVIETTAERFFAKPSDLSAECLQKFSVKVDERYFVIQELITDLNAIEDDEAAVAELDAYANKVQTQYDKVKSDITNLLSKYSEKRSKEKVQPPAPARVCPAAPSSL